MARAFSPGNAKFYRDALAEGFARPGARRTRRPSKCLRCGGDHHDDVEPAADKMRPMYALYFGGMGARSMNFQRRGAAGLRGAGMRIQDCIWTGKRTRPRRPCPTRLVEELALIGSEDKIRDDL